MNLFTRILHRITLGHLCSYSEELPTQYSAGERAVGARCGCGRERWFQIPWDGDEII